MPPENTDNAMPVIIKRIFRYGRVSMALVIPPQFRRKVGWTENDWIGVRLRIIQGRSFLIMEKIPMSKLASPPELPVDVLPSAR